MRSNMQRL